MKTDVFAAVFGLLMGAALLFSVSPGGWAMRIRGEFGPEVAALFILGIIAAGLFVVVTAARMLGWALGGK